MKKWFGKKQIVLTSLLLALGLAVYLNYYFAGLPGGTPAGETASQVNLGDSRFVDGPAVKEQPADDYFTQARQNRQAAHQESVDLIRDVMDNVKADANTQKQAADRLEALTGIMEKESKIENLVKAAGFSECLAYIEEGSCYVVVRAAALTDAQALQISGIATDQSGLAAQKISIVTVE
ncbi:MAG: SpoIIIAH-like family protein [Clostridia bacterium]|nr:SpoIIIAH-like family protein [Clostridia bacterium]